MKRLKCSILCVGMICNILFTGCSTEIKPDSKEEGVYATQNPLSAVEYSIYMNKQDVYKRQTKDSIRKLKISMWSMAVR